MNATSWRAALSIQASATSASWTGVRLMTGYRAIEWGANPLYLGLMATAFALPALLTALPIGRISDRVGGSIVSTTGLFVSITGALITIFFPTLPILLIAVAFSGLGNILVTVGQQTFVAHVSAGGSKDAAFGTLTAAASIGQLIGPPLVTIAASLMIFTVGQSDPNTTVGLIVCIAFSALATPAFFFTRRTDLALQRTQPKISTSNPKTVTLLRIPGLWRSLVVSGAVLVSIDLMYAFLPVWAIQQNISATTVGLLLALRAAVSVLSRLGLSRLVARFGRKAIILVSISLATAGLIALPFVGVWGAAIVMIGLGLGLGVPQPLTMAWVTDLTPAASHGATLGMRLTANRLAQISLPLAVGAVAAPLGVIGIFWTNAALLVGTLAVMSRSDAGAAKSSAVIDPPELFESEGP